MDTVPARPTGFSPIDQYQRGRYYEQQARYYLEHAGLHFVAANVIVKGGEIDLIMQEHQSWIFVEVRYRASDWFGGALASVTQRKQRRMYRAAAVWLLKQGCSLESVPCRFDLLAITGSPAVIEWLPNAFTFDS